MTPLVVAVLLATCCLAAVADSNQEWRGRGASQILSRLSTTNYSWDEPPSVGSGRPTTVRIGMHFHSVKVDEENSEFSCTISFVQSWTDTRLATNENGTKETQMPENSWDRIWTPDLFIRNAVGAKFHATPSQQKSLNILEDGTVKYYQRLSAVVWSPISLERFPHDTHKFQMFIESWSHFEPALIIKPNEKPVKFSSETVEREFQLIQHATHDCSETYPDGRFSCLEISFTLRRNSGYYILAVYIPSILFVILSWFVFWIDRESSSVRLLTGVLLLITLNLTAVLTRSSAPHVSYITCLDVWFVVCHIFVFATLLEYFVVLVLSRKSSDSMGLKIFSPPSHNKANADTVDDDSRGKQNAFLLDWVSRILFPAAFLIFNLIYWIPVARHNFEFAGME